MTDTWSDALVDLNYIQGQTDAVSFPFALLNISQTLMKWKIYPDL